MLQSLCSQLSRQLVIKNSTSLLSARCISISSACRVKEVIEHREGKTLTIDAVVKKSDRFHRLFDPGQKNGACPLCALGLDVKHTDVLILQQFMTRNGGVLPRRITGLCAWQQRKLNFMVAMAIQAGLMPDYGIATGMFESDWLPRFKNYNSYYDENTITVSKHQLWLQRKAKRNYAAELAMADELQ